MQTCRFAYTQAAFCAQTYRCSRAYIHWSTGSSKLRGEGFKGGYRCLQQDAWGWTRFDVARALRFVLPGCKGPPAAQPCRGHDEPNIKWDDIRTIAAALGVAEAAAKAAAAPAVASAAAAPTAAEAKDDMAALCRALAFATGPVPILFSSFCLRRHSSMWELTGSQGDSVERPDVT